MVFIRAPIIVDMNENVELIYEFDGNIVAVKQDIILATSFHPELTDNTGFYEYFIKLIV